MVKQIATSVVDSLRSQPLALALVVVNTLFLIFLFWALGKVEESNRIDRAQRDTLISELQKACNR